MSQIKQLLRLHSQGYSVEAIARTLGISKNTVKSYLSKLESVNIEPRELLELGDLALENKFHAGNPAYKDPRYVHLKGKLITSEVSLRKSGEPKITLGRIHSDLPARIRLLSVLLSFTPAACGSPVVFGSCFPTRR